FGLVNAGYYAIESMRLEKGYRAFGRELTPDYNPVEAGLLFACKLGTDISFLGREAVEKARAAGPRRKPVSLVGGERGAAPPRAQHPPQNAPPPPPAPTAGGAMWGGARVLREGVAVGQVMSGAWGETLGAYVGLAYVRPPDGGVVPAARLREGSY